MLRLFFGLVCLILLYFAVPVFYVAATKMPLVLFLVYGGAAFLCAALALFGLRLLRR